MADQLLRTAVFVEKGGVGKTTSAAHLATAAARDHEFDTLLINLAGSQNDLASQFGFETTATDDGLLVDGEPLDAPLSAAFGDQWDYIRENIPDVLDRMTFETGEGPDLIPSDPGIEGADNNLANVPREDRYDRLDRFLSETVAPEYDLVVLDLPGKETNIALNGLFAAENIVAPLKPGEFERSQLAQLDQDLDRLGDRYPIAPRLALTMATMVDRRTKQAESFVEYLSDEYPAAAGEPIPATANIGSEQANGRTLIATPDDELYRSGREACEAYRQNTNLLIDRIQQ